MQQTTMMTSNDAKLGSHKRKVNLLAGTSAITANQVVFQLEVQIFLARFML